MEIIDAQIHAPRPVLPLDASHSLDVEMLLTCELAREAMDSVGVDVAVVNSGQDVLDYCVARYPNRFVGCVSMNSSVPDLEQTIATYRQRPGMLAIRVRVVDWATKTVTDEFASGNLERVFGPAEEHGVPVFCAAMGVARVLGPVASAHPDLTLIVDHFGVSSPPPMRLVDPDPWASLPDVLSLAAFPNVAVKFSGATALSREPYPHRDLWEHLHRVVEAFGPERLMWGSDFTRLRMGSGTTDRGPREEWGGLYSEVVHFLRDTDELSEEDKTMIFSGTLRRLLRWPGATVEDV
jgi:L-fuconolactonase